MLIVFVVCCYWMWVGWGGYDILIVLVNCLFFECLLFWFCFRFVFFVVMFMIWKFCCRLVVRGLCWFFWLNWMKFWNVMNWLKLKCLLRIVRFVMLWLLSWLWFLVVFWCSVLVMWLCCIVWVRNSVRLFCCVVDFGRFYVVELWNFWLCLCFVCCWWLYGESEWVDVGF